MITGDNPWISCTPYIDDQRWKDDFNDQLFLQKSGPASWTHLQVKKADILREFSVPIERIATGVSVDNLPKMQSDILQVARKLWPTGKTPPRIKERNRAIQAEFKEHPPSEKTIRRALKHWR